MKHTSRMIALAGLAILVIAMLHLRNPLQHSKSLLTECWTASQLLADGGAPMPPWPPNNPLLADGGAPMPPWPPNNSLLADGGAPMPPNSRFLDGGSRRTAHGRGFRALRDASRLVSQHGRRR